MKTKPTVQKLENFKKMKPMKSRNRGSGEIFKNFSQPKIFNNTVLDNRVIKGKFALWVGTNRWEKRPSLYLDLRWKIVHCSTGTSYQNHLDSA